MPTGKESPSSGSCWQRWDPHVHTPGTLFNDNFAGDWDGYIAELESKTPELHALGVTDYYLTDNYEQVRAAKADGRLPHCTLIFPNIEIRLNIDSKRACLNTHLLVDPTDPNHLEELSRFLQNLTFEVKRFGDTFRCSRNELMRLGRRVDPTILHDNQAVKKGAEQFKVDFNQLRQAYENSDWAINNVIVAVAGGSNDGVAGLQDPADSVMRAEIQRFADAIFSGNPKDRDFWLGKGKQSAEDIKTQFGNLKPCLHGSDAHKLADAGSPAQNRFTWVKGAVSFDTLRQACIDPERAYVGQEPPTSAMPSQTIASVKIGNAPWAISPCLPLNAGLVAIIGPRGSGKTALADMIARGCNATDDRLSKQSFLVRARGLLAGATVRLRWADGSSSGDEALDTTGSPFDWEPVRARYLSQKFVEELCSSDGVTDELLQEIERVVFEAHPITERDGATDFQEFVQLRAGLYRSARAREEVALVSISERISAELEKQRLTETLEKQTLETKNSIVRYTADRARLVAKGSESRLARLEAVTAAAETVRGYHRVLTSREQSLLALKGDINDQRMNQFPEELRRLSGEHTGAGLKDDDWTPFALTYVGDVDASVESRLRRTRDAIAFWKGQTPEIKENSGVPYVAADADLQKLPLAQLEAEIGRLQKLVSFDQTVAVQFAAVSRKISEESASLARLEEKLADYKEAKNRVNALRVERQASYKRVFEAVVAEQSVLAKLYAPLMERVIGAAGALGRLSFSVKRVADVDTWSSQGEALLDLRRQGPLKGRGTLRNRAQSLLKAPWESGSVDEVAEAMARFREETAAEDIKPFQKSDDQFRAWARDYTKWLYRTDHIAIQYTVDYGGVDIQSLSPGTRGIVLLLLYLALDNADYRPLIVDQPEENLDPQSIFDELVPLFVRAKRTRQVIIVTHNANLVVNTDADQVIIASAGPSVSRQLPPISYMSGGLEEAHIRSEVCKILEGGEPAFRERARRLRIALAHRLRSLT